MRRTDSKAKFPTVFFTLGVIFFCSNYCGEAKRETVGTPPSASVSPSPSTPGESFALNTDVFAADVREFTAQPHTFGSSRQAELATFIKTRAESASFTVEHQSFTVEVPRRDAWNGTPPLKETRNGINVVARPPGSYSCLVLLGSHYDTKDVPGVNYVGANDSASSSAALLQILPYLARVRGDHECAFAGVWFDGEEAVLDQWDDGLSHPAKTQDNTYGSRQMAGSLGECTLSGKKAYCLGQSPVVALVLLDMIGSPGIKLTRELNSSQALLKIFDKVVKNLGYQNHVAAMPQRISDDHLPFLAKGMKAIDIIDFSNINFWHRDGDNSDTLSPESVSIAGQVASQIALEVAKAPQDFL